jgi:glycosyltransferase involved in cell wall biosynthesis
MSHILHILQEPLQPDTGVSSGNDLRTRQLDQGLREAGCRVTHASLRKPGEAGGPGRFAHRDELLGLVLREKPDIILVAYWELLSLLPFGLAQPVVLDFVAPRPLEDLFERPDSVRPNIARLRAALHRCDLVLCGNEHQSGLLVPLLLEAGHDLRQYFPVRVVPLGAPLAAAPATQPGPQGLSLVMGGVSWPWRNEQPWLEALDAAAEGMSTALRVTRFEGPYRNQDIPGEPAATLPPRSVIRVSPLLPYPQYSDFLTRQAHVGVELADWNVERAYSQSFRSLDFLRHGLPLLCNRYLPLAQLVQQYDAGWLVDKPQDLGAALREASDAATWQRKSAAAGRLAAEKLSIAATTAPLLEWLQHPRKSPRLPEASEAGKTPPVLGVPPLRTRLQRQYGLARQVATARLFGQQKGGEGVLFVTRSDLFPADHGAAVRTVETARALGAQGLPVAIVTDDPRHWYEYEQGDFGGEFRSRNYPAWLRFCSLPAPLVKLLHYSRDIPQSNAFLYLPLTDSGFFWRILAVGKRIRAGILQAEFPAYAAPCLRARPVLRAPVVLVEHNIEYRRMREQVPELTEEQYQRLRAIEIDLCKQVNAVVCVSDPDRQILIDDGVPPQQLSTLPHGVHLSRYEADAQPGIREQLGVAATDALLVFHGTFSYPPNRQAIRVFAEELLPRLDALGLRAHVLAVGRDAPSSSPHERIHFTGSVGDVAPWLKAADLAVIPLLEGGGTRMKIIDCFAARRAVISTSKGIEGIPIEAGKQALVLDDWQDMAQAIAHLVQDPQRREAIADAAWELVKDLDWSEIARRYRALYSSL